MADTPEFIGKLDQLRTQLQNQLRRDDPGRAPIIPGYIVVPAPYMSTAIQELEREGVEANPLSAAELMDTFLGGPTATSGAAHDIAPEGDLTGALLASMLESIGYLKVNVEGNERLFELIEGLRSRGPDGPCVDARPLFRMFPFNHWSAQPGEDDHSDLLLVPGRARKPVADHLDPEANAGWPVWVIDGSYDANNPWNDLIGSRITAGPYNQDGDHGTFVTGLIAVMSPLSCIRVLDTDFSDVGSASQPPALNEISVGVRFAEAIFRYKEKFAPDPGVINLSVGTYDINIDKRGEPGRVESLVPLTLEYQLEMTEGQRELRIVAAGGNDRGHIRKRPNGPKISRVAYPASDRRVIGVGAGHSTTKDGELVWYLWDDELGSRSRSPEEDAWYPRLDDLAPGLNILGPGAGNKVICWSGSSFAAALYSGHLAGYGTPPVRRDNSGYPAIAFDPLGS